MKHLRFAAGAALVLALGAPAVAALAAEPVTLTSDVMIEKVVTEAGQQKRMLVPAGKAVPGDNLVFTTRYTNASGKPVTQFVVTNPLPRAVLLQAEAKPDFIMSADGGATWGALAALKVSDGKGGKRPATAADVTHIRWVIPTIPAGTSGFVSYRATVK